MTLVAPSCPGCMYSGHPHLETCQEAVRNIVNRLLAEKHTVRKATEEERKEDCCSDRYSVLVSYICSCGKQLCRSCMSQHLLDLHEVKE